MSKLKVILLWLFGGIPGGLIGYYYDKNFLHIILWILMGFVVVSIIGILFIPSVFLADKDEETKENGQKGCAIFVIIGLLLFIIFTPASLRGHYVGYSTPIIPMIGFILALGAGVALFRRR